MPLISASSPPLIFLDEELPETEKGVGAITEYWDKWFTENNSQPTDWFQGPSMFGPIFDRHLTPSSRILIVGCGSSTTAHHLYSQGYHNVIATDVSEVAINYMKENHQHECPTVEWQVECF